MTKYSIVKLHYEYMVQFSQFDHIAPANTKHTTHSWDILGLWDRLTYLTPHSIIDRAQNEVVVRSF